MEKEWWKLIKSKMLVRVKRDGILNGAKTSQEVGTTYNVLTKAFSCE